MDFKTAIAESLGQVVDIVADELYFMLEVPPNPDMGDYAFPCFRLAKTMRKAPQMIAKELAQTIQKPDCIESINVQAAYVNFVIDKKIFVSSVLESVFQNPEHYGEGDIGAGKTVIIDYSSPNIAKPFHVGHLRSTVIGNALKNIYGALGYQTVGINHLGDWGTQFGKLIVAYKLWGSKEAVEEKGISELMRIYVKFHDEAENNKELEEDARNWFLKMQNGEEEALNLWKWFYDISVLEFNRIYQVLGVSFDAYTGESFYNDKTDAVVLELKEKQLLTQSRGAQVVDLEEENMPPCLIVRQDGGTLYATRDIAAALYRKETYEFDKCLYLTALDQNLHFSQFFKVIEKMGYDWAKNLVHVPFGLVSLETGKLSTRKGNIVLMEELLDEAVQKTKSIMTEKNQSLENQDEVAKQVGIGAVIFNDLYNGRIKDVVFSWDRLLNFDGETGPYVQYNYVRAISVIKKSGKSMETIINTPVNPQAISNATSVALLKLIYEYPEKITEAAEKNEPSILSRHVMAIAQAFNKFYMDRENVVLGAKETEQNARLALVGAVATVIRLGLKLLGIQCPEKM